MINLINDDVIFAMAKNLFALWREKTEKQENQKEEKEVDDE